MRQDLSSNLVQDALDNFLINRKTKYKRETLLEAISAFSSPIVITDSFGKECWNEEYLIRLFKTSYPFCNNKAFFEDMMDDAKNFDSFISYIKSGHEDYPEWVILEHFLSCASAEKNAAKIFGIATGCKSRKGNKVWIEFMKDLTGEDILN